jgi:hypothetical protein
MIRLCVRERRDRSKNLLASSGEQVLMKRHQNLRTSSISSSEKNKKDSLIR